MSNFVTVVNERTGVEAQAHWTALSTYAERGWFPADEIDRPEDVPVSGDVAPPDEAVATPNDSEEN